MSFYLSNSDTHPTGFEPLEFIDDPSAFAGELPWTAAVTDLVAPPSPDPDRAVATTGDGASWLRNVSARRWPFDRRRS